MNQAIQGYEIFKNAPIREAIFEIGIKELPQTRISELEALHAKFKNHFPEIKPIEVFEKFFSIGTPPPDQPKDKSWITGYQLWAANHQELHTCRLNGFSYNKLKPYKDGNSAIQNALSGWKIFQENIQDASIDKFAVRNINVIDIPESKYELSDYFKFAPDVPSTLNDNDIVGYFINVTLIFPEEKAHCSITMTPQPSVGSGTSILLDIEAKKAVEGSIDLTRIREELECLKYVKDKVFFSMITDKAREMFR